MMKTVVSDGSYNAVDDFTRTVNGDGPDYAAPQAVRCCPYPGLRRAGRGGLAVKQVKKEWGVSTMQVKKSGVVDTSTRFAGLACLCSKCARPESLGICTDDLVPLVSLSRDATMKESAPLSRTSYWDSVSPMSVSATTAC